MRLIRGYDGNLKAQGPVVQSIVSLRGQGRAPDNFLKQGVADALLGAKGVFLQNPEVFPLPTFYTQAFLEFGNLV